MYTTYKCLPMDVGARPGLPRTAKRGADTHLYMYMS